MQGADSRRLIKDTALAKNVASNTGIMPINTNGEGRASHCNWLVNALPVSVTERYAGVWFATWSVPVGEGNSGRAAGFSGESAG